MIEKFTQTQSAEQERLIDSGEFEVRFAQFFSDPVLYLRSLRLAYLDEHEGDISELVSDVVEEVTGYLEHASEKFPQIEDNLKFSELLKARDNDDLDTTTSYLFELLKEAGYTKEEIVKWIEVLPDFVSGEKELGYRAERLILNRIYGE